MRKTKIECSPAVRELNESIETADLLTDYQWDRFTGEQVACALENSGCPYHAADLRNKLAAARVLTPEAAKRYCDGDMSATDDAGHEAIAREVENITRDELDQ